MIARQGAVVVWAIALAMACSSDEDPAGAGGAGGTPSAGGSGGEAPGCVPAECPQPESECEYALCDGDACGFGDVQAGLVCAGGVCDGAGSCVDHCTNGTKDFSETDVDCGGLCDPCAAGQSCIVEGDCTTGFCSDTICCDVACDGACVACNLAGSAGTCAPHAEGTDPDADCAPDTCSGSGSCRCEDGTENGAETDVDCGGGSCPGCADGLGCLDNADCLSNNCVGSLCAP